MLERLFKPSELQSDPFVAPRAQVKGVPLCGEPSFRKLADQSRVGIYSCDASAVIGYYSDRAAELWGRRPPIGDTDERFCGSFIMYRPDGSYMPHDQCPMADVLSGKVPGVFDAEVHIRRQDGSSVVAIVNIVPVIDNDGRIVGAVNSFYDVADLEPTKP